MNWISAQKQWPETCVGVLVYNAAESDVIYTDVQVAWMDTAGAWRSCETNREIEGITHWMYKPAPPSSRPDVIQRRASELEGK